MALTGSETTLYVNKFKDYLIHELQKEGSVLQPLFPAEQISGDKTYFRKLGAFVSGEKTQRNQLKEYTNLTAEKRYIQFRTADFNHAFDMDDALRFDLQPTSDVIKAARDSIGRKVDEFLLPGIVGAVNKEVDGVLSSATITNTILVGDTDYAPAAVNADSGLNPWKIKKAIKLLRAARVKGDIICLAPMSQLTILSTYLQTMSGDFRSRKVLESPGVDLSLSGWMGVTFIQYEELGTDSSSDEIVYVIAKEAVKIGVVGDIRVDLAKQTDMSGNPESVSVMQRIGATRIHDEGVIKILCDPTKTFATTL